MIKLQDIDRDHALKIYLSHGHYLKPRQQSFIGKWLSEWPIRLIVKNLNVSRQSVEKTIRRAYTNLLKYHKEKNGVESILKKKGGV